MSLSHPGVDFALGRMRDAWIVPATSSSFSRTSCSPFCNGCPIAASLLAQNLPSISPATPPLPSESCPPQRAHVKHEKLTHDRPEEHLPNRRTEKEGKSQKCSSALLCPKVPAQPGHPRPAPYRTNVTAVLVLLISDSFARLKRGHRSALSPDLNLMLAEIFF